MVGTNLQRHCLGRSCLHEPWCQACACENPSVAHWQVLYMRQVNRHVGLVGELLYLKHLARRLLT